MAEPHVCAISARVASGDGWVRVCTGDLLDRARPACGKRWPVEAPEPDAVLAELATSGLRRLSTIPLDRIREASGPPPAALRPATDCEICEDAHFVRRSGEVIACPQCTPPPPITLGVPEKLQAATFAAWIPELNDTAQMREALKRCKAIAAGDARTASIAGKPGRGKSHLAAAALNASTWPKPGFWIEWGKFWGDLRGRMFSGEEEHFTERAALKPLMTLPGLLVLDDVGAGDGGSVASQQRLYLVVEARYSANLPTILTTNDLAKVEDRVISRLADGKAGLLLCDGPNDVRRMDLAAAGRRDRR